MSDGKFDGAVVTVIGDNCKRLLRRVMGRPGDAPAAQPAAKNGSELRSSSGLREFWKGLKSPSALQILDLGAASQSNVNFITGLGHKLYTEDLVRTLLSLPPPADAANEWDEQKFFRENLNYAESQFDGILCWDLFDFLGEPMVKPLVERLHRCLRPGGFVLCFFHTIPAGQPVAFYQYQIRTESDLQLRRRGSGNVVRNFNNRTIENLFRSFASLRFYLARDNLREVITVR